MSVREELTKAEKLIKDVATDFPHITNSNTETTIYCIEEVARRKGMEITQDEIWVEVKSIMRTKGYQMETLTRARRSLYQPTKAQREKEYEMHKEFVKH